MTFPMPMMLVSGNNRDPYFDNVSLLLHCNSIPITDSSKYGRVPVNVENISVSNSIFKFGDGSFLFNGTSSAIVYTGSPDLDPRADDFTLELWIRFRSLTGQRMIWSGGLGNSGFFLFWIDGNTLQVARQGIASLLTYNWTGRSTGTWYYLAVSRQSGVMRIFIDGAMVQSGTVTQNFPAGSQIVIGTYGGSGAGRLDAYVDDLRFTKGVCRYVANFTPPSSQLPDK